MTERLQEILNDLPSSIRHSGELEPLKKYAREQAERVQELEELTHKQGKVIIKQSDELDIFDQQNKRYREALEEILAEAYEEAGVHPDTGMQLETYIVRIARKALEREG